MKKIKNLRVQAGLSQAQLAALSGVSVRNIQKYETGELFINNARAIIVYDLSVALDCSVADLLEFETKKETEE